MLLCLEYPVDLVADTLQQLVHNWITAKVELSFQNIQEKLQTEISIGDLREDGRLLQDVQQYYNQQLPDTNLFHSLLTSSLSAADVDVETIQVIMTEIPEHLLQSFYRQ